MAYEFKLTRQVDFAETDTAGIMHFSNFFRFMEAAETAFFRSLGQSIYPRDHETVGWPRVHADCDFRHPLRFEDRVEIHLLVRAKGEKSLAYTFIFRKLDHMSRKEVARGNVVTACVSRDKFTGKMTAVPIPFEIAGLIETAPDHLFASPGD
ncbi:MAG: acyl-CoA thioesterase [Acidimicrobiia bacterium]|nr:acyl-CoA thioesterase [Acidimicrobiia bacterium]